MVYKYQYICFALFISLPSLWSGGAWKKGNASEEDTKLYIRAAAAGIPSSPEGLAYKDFAARVEEKSAGQIHIELFLSGQLGNFKSVINELRSGDLEISQSGPPSFLVAEAEILGAPYLIRGRKHLAKVMQQLDFAINIKKKLEKKGLKILTFISGGSRQTTSNRPIYQLSDMKGLKIRVPNDDFLLAYARYTGANPTPISFPEVYLALQSRQVDAQENPLGTIKAMKFYEVQPYLAITNHYSAGGFLYYSLRLWEKLSPKQQQIILEAAQFMAEKSQIYFDNNEAADEDFLLEQGMHISRPDLQPFRQAMEVYYEELAQKHAIPLSVIEQIRNLAE